MLAPLVVPSVFIDLLVTRVESLRTLAVKADMVSEVVSVAPPLGFFEAWAARVESLRTLVVVVGTATFVWDDGGHSPLLFHPSLRLSMNWS